ALAREATPDELLEFGRLLGCVDAFTSAPGFRRQARIARAFSAETGRNTCRDYVKSPRRVWRNERGLAVVKREGAADTSLRWKRGLRGSKRASLFTTWRSRGSRRASGWPRWSKSSS